jgi:hypothetical protein
MSTKTRISSLAFAAVALTCVSASAAPFHKGWVLTPNGTVHPGWVALSRPVPTAYAYQPATAARFANDPTMYAVRHNIPVPAVQLPGGGSP